MKKRIPRIFFDRNDYQLLEIVDDVLERGQDAWEFRSLLVEHMHPHGIKEMAAPRGLRIAYAVVSLLGSFEKGRAHDRLKALRSLRDEVLFSGSTYYQRNTARVLIQIMKELVRTRGNTLRRLKLAHDFRMVSTGTPRRVRKELANYHLVEMPEEWNQLAFDDHVHDANTKGRKSPTHLVMDAWIKGIRSLNVIYYNWVRPDVIEELLEAGSILEIDIHVSIEFSTRFQGKYVRFAWEPAGFPDKSAFLKFLDKEAVREFLEEGRKVSQYQQQYVFDVLSEFNDNHRLKLNADFGLALPPLELADLLAFVGKGQPSILHLARFIHNGLSDHVTTLLTETEPCREQTETGRCSLDKERLQQLTVESIITNYLRPEVNPGLHNPNIPHDGPELPELLQCGLPELLSRLHSLHPSSNFTLNLGNLSAQDTLELLYRGKGLFTHIEAYNLNSAGSWKPEMETRYQLISRLQKALSDDNVINLKSVIRDIILDHEEQLQQLRNGGETGQAEKQEEKRDEGTVQAMQERKLRLIDILSDLESLHNSYRKRTLKSRIGSGSTGQAEHRSGMGFVVLETLPARARKQFYAGKGGEGRIRIPVTAQIVKNSHTRIRSGRNRGKGWQDKVEKVRDRWQNWDLERLVIHPGTAGNIGTLGGLSKQLGCGVEVTGGAEAESIGEPWRYLNTHLKNSAKVLLGFIPAFFTFYLTKEWWVLAYLGAVIWFGITGSRNIIQSVFGGGGLRRSPLLPWNSLISWSRISDSLLYTGFSVPLLDYVVKTLLLDHSLGVTTATNPVLLYAIMGLANGVYISSHNLIRGLPRTATIGNFFRSILAIPVAILLNTILGILLGAAGLVGVQDILQKWAAIISKFASDCVAAIIEGVADRQTNIQARLTDYRTKIAQLFSVYSRLDLLYPEEDLLAMFQVPKVMMKTLSREAQDLEKLIIVNALDLMYFWMYQPRSRKALGMLVEEMSEEEWLIFYRSQLILTRHREISQVFVDGLVGKQFGPALSFYLDQSVHYMNELKKLHEKAAS